MEILERALEGQKLNQSEIVSLFTLPLPELAAAAHEARLARTDPKIVTYLIDRNINYSNVCTIGCSFCAFYRTERQKDAYVHTYQEISQKVSELEAVGGHRILMQGGVHPSLPFEWYLDLLRYLKTEHPSLRIDAFSPEEILGLERLTGLSAREILTQLKDAGLDGLPGAGGEILVDEVRQKAAPARIKTGDWFRIMDLAQSLGLYTLATMVIGFGEGPEERALHLARVRDQQERSLARGQTGFAAFALWTLQTEHTRIQGKAPGASAYDYLRTLAVARLALNNLPNLQASWPTLGFKIAQSALFYGANDFGSTMLEENVVSQASGSAVTCATETEIIHQIKEAGFIPAERDVFYQVLRYPEMDPVSK